MEQRDAQQYIEAVEEVIRCGNTKDYTQEEVAELVGEPDNEEVVGVELYLKVTANLKITRKERVDDKLQEAYAVMQWSDWHPDNPDTDGYLDWFVEMEGFNLLSGPVLEGKPGRSVIDCYPPTGGWQLHSMNLDIRNNEESEEEF